LGGAGPGDGFKGNLDYYDRLPSLRAFYAETGKLQKGVARQIGNLETPFVPRVKPQLGPCYTSYPSTLSVFAAIGHTGYLEMKARMSEKLLFTYLKGYLEKPAEVDHVSVDPTTYARLARIVTDCVETRLLLEELSRINTNSYVEIYRLFLASQQTLDYESVPAILRSVVLYGDVLPDWESKPLHPMTKSILGKVTHVSNRYLGELSAIRSHRLIDLGTQWVRDLCYSLSLYLPSKDQEDGRGTPEAGGWKYGYGGGEKAEMWNSIDPLKSLHPPSLFDTEDARSKFDQMLPLLQKNNAVKPPPEDAKPEESAEEKIIKAFAETVRNASAQGGRVEDMRSDILERKLRLGDFSEGPITGDPADGHIISVRMGEGGAKKGEIFDRAIPLSEDLHAYYQLLMSRNLSLLS
jgi:hypothetical protein